MELGDFNNDGWLDVICSGGETGVSFLLANNQLATREDGWRLHARGITYAPDYVINAGGIINVCLEYMGQGDRAEVEARIHKIPDRLNEVWDESERTGEPASAVADVIAQRLIGRA